MMLEVFLLPVSLHLGPEGVRLQEVPLYDVNFILFSGNFSANRGSTLMT